MLGMRRISFSYCGIRQKRVASSFIQKTCTFMETSLSVVFLKKMLFSFIKNKSTIFETDRLEDIWSEKN